MIHARNFASGRSGEAKLAALVDPHQETLKKAQQALGIKACFTDLKQALEMDDLDAVIIATPTVFHHPMVTLAAQAGKHILCEKPMALDSASCQEMIAAAEKNKVLLQIGFMRRFDPGFIEAKARIEGGEIGEVVQVKSLTHGPSIPKPWMYDLSKSNGPLAEVNSHDLDSLRWFTGEEYEEIYAVGGNFRSPEARSPYPDFYDNVSLCARMTHGRQGFVGGAQGGGYGYDARCEILGTRGILLAGSLAGSKVIACTQGVLSSSAVTSWTELFREAYLAEDRDFISAILEGRPPRATGHDGWAAVRAVQAGNESIRTGLPVKVARS
jgi:myo-inositol 2-dehydrogenase/D-chiro-inositol 1-dehydrogenase/scyllo-inositol 2-dehydrogenase (NAD+)